MNIMKKKIQADENGCKYILSRIDIFFSQYFLAIEIDEKGHTDRYIIFEEKRKEALEKKNDCKFIRINTSNAKNGYEVGNVKTFIDEFKIKKIKKLEKQLMREKEKEMREKVEKEIREKLEKELKDKNLTNNQVTNNFGKIIIKN